MCANRDGAYPGWRTGAPGDGAVSDVAGALAWLASGAGAVGGGVAAAAVHPVLVIPVLVIVTSLASLPLLIPTLALIALYSSDPDRQARAAEILNRLLAALRGGKQGEAEDQSEAAVDRFERTQGSVAQNSLGSTRLRHSR